jgi:carbon storage regulator
LVLSRRAGESVVIGDDVVVTVLEVRGDVVRLGIRAPRSVQVHREEVFRELQRANQAAAASSTDRAEQVLSALLRPPDPAAPPRPPKPTKPPKPPKPA